ncbi:hypothetical protein BGZ61DRAFT_536379 [Ilyonectria robusta]|uniref:uncharacterized protein n=1 Tax=Ilyonectria robusta TaxID=1079257 RepID=UPI001E8DBDD3|nr:uncharacterized protein BGZ61DRAFT_536379 [Ilyonectria robusta]KAH8675093.1 hypothetical protein BGZ61DRAFT_536379 [Ilyonectria robusta]
MASIFSLSASPSTDIWKKPPSTNVFKAPSRPHSSGPVSTFASAAITFTTTYTHQYDQAGMLLTITNPADPAAPRKWIKAGIEYYNGIPRLSVVCCDSWADWSVAQVTSGADEIIAGTKSVTINVVREDDEHGSSWWVYHVDGDKKTPLREICWVLGDNGGEGLDVKVSALVARPGKVATDELEANFSDFDVEWK